MPVLIIEKGKEKGRRVRLKENVPTVLGRDMRCQLRISDVMCSRRHCQIEGRLGRWVLKDLDSSNGVTLNGEWVEGEAELSYDDRIQVGETQIYFVKDEEHERKGPLSGKEIAGYRVGNVIGRGGMGSVYDAVQISLERNVALKVLAPELVRDKAFIERFISEARAAGQLNHPNIVQVYDVGHVDEVYFFSMELVKNGSVTDLLRKDKKLAIERCLAFGLDAARGLEYAERKGVVHRDIKPDNLMLSEDWVVKIGDLGIAQKTSPDTKTDQEEGISGSPFYIAPEQAMGKKVDTRADIYALGISLWEMLSGEPPFQGNTMREIVLKHVREEVPDVRSINAEVPDEIAALVRRMTQRNPDDRFAHADELVSELGALCQAYPLRDSQRSSLPIDLRTAKTVSIAPGEIGRATPGSSARTPANAPKEPASADGSGSGSRSGSGSSAKVVLEEDAPDSALVSPDAPAPAGSGLSPVIMGCLVVIVLGVAAFSSVFAYHQARKWKQEALRVQQEREQRVLAIESALGAGKPEQALARAKELAEQTDDEAWKTRALELVAQAEAAIARREADAREQAAAARLVEIEKQVPERPEALDALGTPQLEALLAALKTATAALEPFAREHPDTEAVKEAAALAAKLADDIPRVDAALRARNERLAAERDRIDEVAREVERLRRDDRFGEAFAKVGELRGLTLAESKAAAQRLLAETGQALRERTDAVVSRAAQQRRSGRPDRAKTELEAYKRKVGVPKIVGELDSAIAEADREAAAIAERERVARIAADREQIDGVAREDDVRALRFESVRRDLELVRGRLKTEDGRATLERRLEVVGWAIDARDRIIDHINGAKLDSGITTTLASQTLYAVKASVDLGVDFEDKRGRVGTKRRWEDLTPDELVQWAGAAPELDPPARLHLAAMLHVLGAGPTARKLADDLAKSLADGEASKDPHLPGKLQRLRDEMGRS